MRISLELLTCVSCSSWLFWLSSIFHSCSVSSSDTSKRSPSIIIVSACRRISSDKVGLTSACGLLFASSVTDTSPEADLSAFSGSGPTWARRSNAADADKFSALTPCGQAADVLLRNASRLTTSSSVRKFLARSCQFIALSVRNCSASPSGSRTGSFCSDTNSDKIVSRRGRLDLEQSGHRYLSSFAASSAAEPLPMDLPPWVRGRGTQEPWYHSLQSSHCSINPSGPRRHVQYCPSMLSPSCLLLSSSFCLAMLTCRNCRMLCISFISASRNSAICRAGSLPMYSSNATSSIITSRSFSVLSFSALSLFLLPRVLRQALYDPTSFRGDKIWTVKYKLKQAVETRHLYMMHLWKIFLVRKVHIFEYKEFFKPQYSFHRLKVNIQITCGLPRTCSKAENFSIDPTKRSFMYKIIFQILSQTTTFILQTQSYNSNYPVGNRELAPKLKIFRSMQQSAVQFTWDFKTHCHSEGKL